MPALKIAFLWHTHQPEYKLNGEFILPWTRFHGVKDYFDIPETLHEFPLIRQTINTVPSMKLQIEEYIDRKYEDRIQKLTALPADLLSDEDKSAILKSFFLCNEEHMILPHSRYRELLHKANAAEGSLPPFSPQDWLDLQVWYNLAWFGPYSRREGFIARLFAKGRGFTEAEKAQMMLEQEDVLRKIVPGLKRLINLNQIEVSISPMYHPILPLLCNSESAREAMPNCILPDPCFVHPEDARAQVENAIKFYSSRFGIPPAGMWPSEGSVSNEALDILIKCGLKWTATDEDILKASLGPDAPGTEKFFPRRYKSPEGSISILFRDHFLSDRIGFVYSSWDPNDAARDFMANLARIREEIVHIHGEEALEHACVPIILDGENCWEFYRENGLPFLRALYTLLSNDKNFRTVLCSEATLPEHSDYRPAISKVRAGSWINSDFSIWIGHEEDRKAWNFLGAARAAVDEAMPGLRGGTREKVMEEIYIAEGSDWFWWYGPEHSAPNKDDFDMMFRERLKNIYRLIGKSAPPELDFPISLGYIQQKAVTHPKSAIAPEPDGSGREEGWENAGCFNVESTMSAMHMTGGNLSRLFFGYGEEKFFLRVVFSKDPDDSDMIEIIISCPFRADLKINRHGISLSGTEKGIRSAGFTLHRTADIYLGIPDITPEMLTDFKFRVISRGAFGEMFWPRSGDFSSHLA